MSVPAPETLAVVSETGEAHASGPVWQNSGFSKNDFGSSFSGGAASRVELEPFWKTFDKTVSPIELRW